MVNSAADLSLRIVSIERVGLNKWEVEGDSKATAKWELVTEIKNSGKRPRLLPSAPYMGGTVNGQMSYYISFWPVRISRSRARIMILRRCPPEESWWPSIRSWCSNTGNGGEIHRGRRLYGMGARSTERGWFLASLEAGANAGGRGIRVVHHAGGSRRPTERRRVLGDDFDKLWRGEMKSQLMKIKVTESDDFPLRK